MVAAHKIQHRIYRFFIPAKHRQTGARELTIIKPLTGADLSVRGLCHIFLSLLVHDHNPGGLQHRIMIYNYKIVHSRQYSSQRQIKCPFIYSAGHDDPSGNVH